MWGIDTVRVRARAYSSSANLGSGFDVLAVALDPYYDEVLVDVERGDGLVNITNISGPYGNVVSGSENNIVVFAVKLLMERFGVSGLNVNISLWKGVPVSMGLGGSGASAVAAVAAAGKAMGLDLDPTTIAEVGGAAEALVAGDPHFDNASASAFGGLIVMLSSRPPIAVRSFKPEGVFFVVSAPKVNPLPGKTRIMRSVLPKSIDLKTHVEASSKLSSLLYGLIRGDMEALSIGLNDVIVEPARSKYVPCYNLVKEYSRKGGALGSVISGAGPAMLTITSKEKLDNTARWIEKAYTECGLEAEVKKAEIAPGVQTWIEETS
ncbi:MAG: homoserine kinase [Thermoprotei archaeon]|nr:homoserine kinase [Thermoprotei archaeon]